MNLAGFLVQVGIVGCLFGSLAASEVFLCLTNVNGVNMLYFMDRDAGANWTFMAVPAAKLTRIEDVDYNYLTKMFHFISSVPEEKGIWTGSLYSKLIDLRYSHKFSRKTTQPKQITLYPEYNSAFLYDEGYEMTVAVVLEETQKLVVKSYFQEVESIRPGIALDKDKNKVFGLGGDSSTIYSSPLTSSTPTVISKLSANASSILALDQSKSNLFYCLSGVIAFKNLLNDSVGATSQIPCRKISASQGAIFFVNETTGEVQKMAYDAVNGFISTNVTTVTASLPMFSSNTKILSFKRIEFSVGSALKCALSGCQHFCFPDDNKNNTCVCADFYAGDKTCVSEPLSKAALIFLEASPINSDRTTVSWYPGDPLKWIKRPYREVSMEVSSRIMALASDFNERRAYAVEAVHRKIFTFLSDGTKLEMTSYNQISSTIKSIAFDWVGNNIYWFDPSFQWLRIVPVRIRGQAAVGYKTAVVMPNLEGYSLALDANAGYLFFLDLDDAKQRVYVIRCLMDGSSAVKFDVSFGNEYFNSNIEDNSPELPLPGALTVDPYTQRVWIAFTNHISVMTYDGVEEHSVNITFDGYGPSNSRVASIGILNSSFAIITLSNFNKTSSVFSYSIETKGSGKCCSNLTLVQKRNVANEFRGMGIYQPPPPLKDQSVNCSALSCSSICTNVAGRATCLCFDGDVWNETTKNCSVDSSHPELPSVIYTKNANTTCYRSVTSLISPDILPAAYAETCYSSAENPFGIIAADHFTNGVFAATQKDFKGPSIFYRSLGAGGNATLVSEFPAGTKVSSLAFDQLSRNLYIADRTSKALLVMPTYFSSMQPATLLTNATIIATAVDSLRRCLYWATFSETESVTTIYQSDLKASTPCQIAKVDGAISQFQISYTNNTLLFLNDPSRGQLGEIGLTTLPEHACATRNISYYKLASRDIVRFALFQQNVFLVNSEGSVYISDKRGQNSPKSPLFNIFGTGATNPKTDPKSILSLDSFAVINTLLPSYLLPNSSSSNWTADVDKCILPSRGGCDQLCLAGQCVCKTGMELYSDGTHCKPIAFDMKSSGVLFAVDESRRTVFAMPLSVLNSSTSQVNVSSFILHTLARPHAVAYDPVDGKLYISGAERQKIFSIKPEEQMRYSSQQTVLPNIEQYTPISDSNSLAVDPATRLLIAAPSEGHNVISMNLTSGRISQIIIANNSISFYGIALDRRPNQTLVYVAALDSTKPNDLFIYSTGQDGRNLSIFKIASNLSHSNGHENIEIAVDGSNGGLYFACNGMLFYQNLSNITAANAKQIRPAEDNSSFCGVQVTSSFLLASRCDSGGITVFDLKTLQNVKTIGKGVFYGLNSFSVCENEIVNLLPTTAATPTSTAISSGGSTQTTTKPGTSSTSSSSTSKPTSSASTANGASTSSSSASTKSKTSSPETNNVTPQAQADGSSNKTGVVVGSIIGAVVILAAIIGVIVYLKKRPRGQGFYRLDDAPAASAYISLEESNSAREGSSVSFRNPLYGMDAVDLDATVRPARPRDADFFSEADGGL